MRILIVSNFYPPHYVGGYELGCYDVVEGLKAKGHQVQVLTSRYGVDREERDGDVIRCFHMHYKADPTMRKMTAFTTTLRHERHNQARFLELCDAFAPEIVYFWNMGALSKSLVLLAERKQLPTSFFVSDNWMAKWEQDDWYRIINTPWGKFDRVLSVYAQLYARVQQMAACRGFAPNLAHVQFCSDYTRQEALQAGKPVTNGKVIHWGIHPERFPLLERCGKPGSLLYVGRISPEKGVHTAIEAMHLLVHDYGRSDVTLTLVGGGVNAEYQARLRDMIRDRHLAEQVQLRGALPREQLLEIYHAHRILLFPSVWEEPFAITPLEAMCSGLVVVGTTRGGSEEIFENGVTAMTFKAEDAQGCADQVLRLLQNPELYQAIRQNGHDIVTQRFTMSRMIAEIEQALCEQLTRRQ
jgi:glycogen(starch) synthase